MNTLEEMLAAPEIWLSENCMACDRAACPIRKPLGVSLGIGLRPGPSIRHLMYANIS
jgi:hypothetical protein